MTGSPLPEVTAADPTPTPEQPLDGLEVEPDPVYWRGFRDGREAHSRPEQDEAVRLLREIVEWWNSRSPGFRKRTRVDLFMQADSFLGQRLATPPPEQDEAVRRLRLDFEAYESIAGTTARSNTLDGTAKAAALASLANGLADAVRRFLASPPPVPAAPFVELHWHGERLGLAICDVCRLALEPARLSPDQEAGDG